MTAAQPGTPTGAANAVPARPTVPAQLHILGVLLIAACYVASWVAAPLHDGERMVVLDLYGGVLAAVALAALPLVALLAGAVVVGLVGLLQREAVDVTMRVAAGAVVATGVLLALATLWAPYDGMGVDVAERLFSTALFALGARPVLAASIPRWAVLAAGLLFWLVVGAYVTFAAMFAAAL